MNSRSPASNGAHPLRVITYLAERVLDGRDDSGVDFVIHRFGNPPGLSRAIR